MKNLKKFFYVPSERNDFFFSIITNIDNILKTRSSLPISKFLECEKLTSIYFGLPAMTHLSMESDKDKYILCNAIEKSIQAFEHRLKYVEVKFSNYDSLKREAKFSLNAIYNNKEIALNLFLKVAFWEFVINE